MFTDRVGNGRRRTGGSEAGRKRRFRGITMATRSSRSTERTKKKNPSCHFSSAARSARGEMHFASLMNLMSPTFPLVTRSKKGSSKKEKKKKNTVWLSVRSKTLGAHKHYLPGNISSKSDINAPLRRARADNKRFSVGYKTARSRCSCMNTTRLFGLGVGV